MFWASSSERWETLSSGLRLREHLKSLETQLNVISLPTSSGWIVSTWGRSGEEGNLLLIDHMVLLAEVTISLLESFRHDDDIDELLTQSSSSEASMPGRSFLGSKLSARLEQWMFIFLHLYTSVLLKTDRRHSFVWG
uniref:Uncharacterized protein n=1 Tax=Cryptomonas curvata TaxID=233186 RepID=A0A7S0QHG3_9CRYP